MTRARQTIGRLISLLGERCVAFIDALTPLIFPANAEPRRITIRTDERRRSGLGSNGIYVKENAYRCDPRGRNPRGGRGRE